MSTQFIRASHRSVIVYIRIEVTREKELDVFAGPYAGPYENDHVVHICCKNYSDVNEYYHVRSLSKCESCPDGFCLSCVKFLIKILGTLFGPKHISILACGYLESDKVDDDPHTLRNNLRLAAYYASHGFIPISPLNNGVHMTASFGDLLSKRKWDDTGCNGPKMQKVLLNVKSVIDSICTD